MKKFTVELTTQYANLCDMVLAPSESIRELLSERQVETRMEVLPTGVDIEHFSNGTEKSVRKEFEIPSSAPVLGHVGRLAKEKNLDYLTAAVCRVLAARSDVWFVVVGDGSFAETMKKITQEKGVHERLAMLGTRSGKELVDAYAAMDVFVFASTSETQGLVLTEAMAAGTPVIALDASGVRDVVEDEVNGRLLPQDTSPKHFADAIVKALSKEYAHALDQWEQNARRTAQLYSRQRCCEKLISIYQRLMNEQKSTNDHGRSDTWERVLNGIKAEWELLLSKGNAAWTATSEE